MDDKMVKALRMYERAVDAAARKVASVPRKVGAKLYAWYVRPWDPRADRSDEELLAPLGIVPEPKAPETK